MALKTGSLVGSRRRGVGVGVEWGGVRGLGFGGGKRAAGSCDWSGAIGLGMRWEHGCTVALKAYRAGHTADTAPASVMQQATGGNTCMAVSKPAGTHYVSIQHKALHVMTHPKHGVTQESPKFGESVEYEGTVQGWQGVPKMRHELETRREALLQKGFGGLEGPGKGWEDG